jgi:PAS domain S-box-containing protein
LAYNLRLVDIDSLGMMPELKRQRDIIYMLATENVTKTTTIEDNASTINRQRSSIMALVGLFVIGCILMFMLAWSFLQKNRDNRALSRINAKMAQQKEEIEMQRENLLNYTKELERMSLIVRETDNAIRVFDREGHTIWVNSGYSRLYGYSLEELQSDDTLGRSINDPIDIKQIIKTWDTERQSIELESEIVNKWNIKLWVQTTLSPIYDVTTMEVSQLIAIDTNITSLKRAQQDILAMNEEITSSITYAKRIQEAMLPPITELTKHYPNSFIYYKPRSIVSGDFYWMTEQSGRIVVVCADSTGHGVPGAFLSLIGISLLSKIVKERGIVQPAVVLNRLRRNVINYLHQETSEPSAGDGMDMSIVSIDKRNNIMEFAGAMTPMYIVREGSVIELKPDRMPVGYYDNENRAFSSSRITLKKGDQLYMFTDGYYDQFGGENGLKMKSNHFKEVLLQCYQKNSKEQVKLLDNEFNEWRGRLEQIDDVLVIGIKIG